MADRHSDTTIRQDQDGNVVFTNQQTQTFSEEDFLQVYEDNLENYKNLIDQLQQMQEQRENILDENGDEITVLNHVLGNEGPELEQDSLEGALSEDAFQQHQQLSQIKEQESNLLSQKARLEEQLQQMSDMATQLSDEVEEFEPEELE